MSNNLTADQIIKAMAKYMAADTVLHYNIEQAMEEIKNGVVMEDLGFSYEDIPGLVAYIEDALTTENGQRTRLSIDAQNWLQPGSWLTFKEIAKRMAEIPLIDE